MPPDEVPAQEAINAQSTLQDNGMPLQDGEPDYGQEGYPEGEGQYYVDENGNPIDPREYQYADEEQYGDEALG